VLRVLIDATAVPADRRGVGRYVDNLIPALVKAGVDVRVACKPADVEHYSELSASDAVAGGPATRHPAARLLWEQTAFPALAAQVAPDLLHSPHYTHPLLSRLPSVVTLHDATFFSDPGVHTRVKGPFFRAATRLAVRRADVCVVASQATADELRRRLGTSPDRLQVAHLGVDSTLFRPPAVAAVAEVRAMVGLRPDEDYIAFLGTLEPRKNVPALIRGWVLASRGRSAPPVLVLSGGTGWDTEAELAAAIAEVPAGLRLLRPGYLPLAQLPALLGGAAVVAYPSLGEGFGLPVLEGMACGAAVLTTRRLSLPEVGGDAVAYCDPDADSIAAELIRLLDDPQRRAELGRAGLARSAQFSWAASAAAHIEAYQRAIRRPAVRA